MDGIITTWVITWRIAAALVVAAGLILLAPIGGLVPKVREWFPPFWMVAVPLAAPLSIIVWSGANWARESGQGTSYATTVHTGLFVGCLVLCVVWPFLMRRARGIGWILGAAVVGFLYSWAAWFVGGMAITNVWL